MNIVNFITNADARRSASAASIACTAVTLVSIAILSSTPARAAIADPMGHDAIAKPSSGVKVAATDPWHHKKSSKTIGKPAAARAAPPPQPRARGAAGKPPFHLRSSRVRAD